MRARGHLFALSSLVAVLAAGSAAAQQPATAAERQAAIAAEIPAPTAAEVQAATRELSFPGGIGGCVMNEIDPSVRTSVLTSFGLGQPGVPPGLAPAVAKVSAACTGRPYSASDGALNAAVLGAFMRTAVSVYFASELAIGQHRLDAVWKSAPATEKAPFLNAAKSIVDPKAPPGAPGLPETAPLARRLKIASNDPGRLAPVRQYYLGMAFSEVAEAQLAAEGAQPP